LQRRRADVADEDEDNAVAAAAVVAVTERVCVSSA